MRRIAIVGILLYFGTAAGSAQLRGAVAQYVAEHQQQIVRELVQLLSIPNVAADRVNVRGSSLTLSRIPRRMAGSPPLYTISCARARECQSSSSWSLMIAGTRRPSRHSDCRPSPSAHRMRP